MERESFENEEVARLLNEQFIAIKVDREERPDIDQVYMSACMAMTGQGGWPLTIVMTPEQKPFFAGTYFPPTARYGRAGLLELLPRLAEAWRSNRERLVEIGEEVARALNAPPEEDLSIEDAAEATSGARGDSTGAAFATEGDSTGAASATEGDSTGAASAAEGDSTGAASAAEGASSDAVPAGPNGMDDGWGAELCEEAYRHFVRTYDQEYGGFGAAPKFPAPHNLLFLLRHSAFSGQPQALHMATETLRNMYRGGIWDHLGYGFARYSTDVRWLVPHFEKMLYDNALLVYTCTEAFAATGDRFFAELCRRTIHYVLRDLTGVNGEFFSGEDADSEGVEGKFYTFTRKQVDEILPAPEALAFCERFDVSASGNFEGVNVLNLPRKREPLLDPARDALAQRVWAARERRIRPLRDDKVLTGWNALMIAALAKAGRVLSDDGFIQAALRAEAFLERQLRRGDGRLLARYRLGEARHLACLDDYAYLAFAQLELFETLGQAAYLDKCRATIEQVAGLFGAGDPSRSGAEGYYFYGHDGETLLARPKEYYDGALPSGNSVVAYVLARLAAISGDDELADMRDRQLAACHRSAKQYPAGHGFYLLAVLQTTCVPREIVLVGSDARDSGLAALREAVDGLYMPTTVLLVKTPESEAQLRQIAPYAADHPMIGGRATAYVCEGFACRAPVTDREALRRLLEK